MLTRLLRRSARLKKACLGAALATAWAANTVDATPYRVTGSITPDQPLSNVYVTVGFAYQNTSGSMWSAYRLTGMIPAYQTTSFEFIVDDSDTGWWGPIWFAYKYAIFGIYDDANDGVTVGMAPPIAQDAISNQRTWNQQFAATYEPTEAQAADYMRTDQGDQLADFGYSGSRENMRTELGAYFGEPTTLVNFSTASAAGTAYAAAVEVPEPASLSVAAAICLVLVRPRRRHERDIGEAV